MFINIGIRHNLIYLLMLIIINLVKLTLLILIEEYLYYADSHLTVFMMFLSEFICGLFLYKYKYNAHLFKKDSNKKDSSFKGIKLINTEENIVNTKKPDSTLKIYFLFIAISFFDFYDTIFDSFYMPPLDDNISKSLYNRLQGILAIITGLLTYLFLKFPMHRHHKCSLVTITICIIMIIIFEYCIMIFTERENSKNSIYKLSKILLFTLLNNFFWSMVSVIEKYLLEYDFVNYFQMLMYEGAFGLILSFIYLLFNKEVTYDEFKDLYDKYDKEHNKFKFIILIIALLFYYFLLGALNGYRVIANKLYSPTSIALVYYIFCPYHILTSYFVKEDFQINGEQNIFYLIFNLIISIIFVFCGCVYNELFVLFCCNLEHETHSQISLRASFEKSIDEDIVDLEEIN